MDLRKEAEKRALLRSNSSTISPVRSSQRFSSRSLRLEVPPSPANELNETVRAAKLAEADYKWNGARSRIPSGGFIPPRWVPDEESDLCYSCKASFDWSSRRHHCRHCGQIACARCSDFSVLLPVEHGYRDPQRVCTTCYLLLLPQQQKLSQSIANHMLSTHLDLSDDICKLGRHCNVPYTSSLNRSLAQASYSLHNLLQGQGTCCWSSDSGTILGMLEQAHGLLFLTIAQGGLMFTGTFGTGLLISRMPMSKGGGWSAPAAVAAIGMGYGMAAGAALSDVIMILGQESVQALSNRMQLSVGLGIELTAGLLGRGASTSLLLSADGMGGRVISYVRSKGLYAGIGLQAMVLTLRPGLDQRFYGRYVSSQDILIQHNVPPPRAADVLYTALAEASSKAPCVHHTAPSPNPIQQQQHQQQKGYGALSSSSGYAAAGIGSKSYNAVDVELETVTSNQQP